MCEIAHSHVRRVWYDAFTSYHTRRTCECVVWCVSLMLYVMSYAWMSHGARMHESRHVHGRVMSYIWTSHVIRMNKWWHIYDMSHVIRMNESRHTYKWVTSHIWMSPATHISMCDITHMNESGHITMSHTFLCHTHFYVTHISMKWRVMCMNASCEKMCVAWRIHLRDGISPCHTHFYDMTCLIHMCDVTHLYVSPCHTHFYDMTFHSHEWVMW